MSELFRLCFDRANIGFLSLSMDNAPKSLDRVETRGKNEIIGTIRMPGSELGENPESRDGWAERPRAVAEKEIKV
jgi:hypothetical protein